MRPITLCLFLAAASAPAWSAAPKPFAFGAVRFEANQGQADRAALYFARARGQHVYFNARDVVFDPSEGVPVRMSFAGASHARWTPVGAPADSISYFVGNDQKRWVKAAPVYHRIAWREVYPGIDAVFYDRDGHVEYDLVLAPGADPALVRLRFTGASSIRNTPAGEIEIQAGAATIRQHAPEIYQQDTHGKRRRVSGRFLAAANGEFRLQLGKYEKTRPLIVDPVLEASTYWGGENDDEITAVGESYVAGNTRSAGFPATAGARRRSRDIFFTGFARFFQSQFDGTIIFGGSGDDELAGVVVTGTSNPAAYLAGTTNSRDFASSNTSAYNGGVSDGFVLELNAFGSPFPSIAVAAFRYVGGSGRDRIHAIQPFSSQTLIAGSTDSPDLETAPGGQRTLGGGSDAFFGIFRRGLAPLLSYLGGSGDDAAYAIQQDLLTSSIFIAGETRSSDFPMAAQPLRGPSDGFLTQVRRPSPTLTGADFQIVTTHLIGGSGEDSVRALSRPFNPFNQFLPVPPRYGIAGITTSPDLPVRNAAQSTFGGESDAFAGIWLSESASFSWLTYLGGSAADGASSASLNVNGDLAVGGWTSSTDLAVADALQPKTGGAQDGLFALLDGAGTLRQLTYFGGSGDDRIDAVAILPSGSTRAGGYTTSSNLPLRRATQQDYADKSDGFYADIGTDYLSGPSELILPKDGVLQVTLRPARAAVAIPVTFRSSDPSRVRFSFAGRSLSELTAAAENGVRVEALSDTGEVEITASADGFPTKTIRVRLYPAALFLSGSTNVSVWSASASATLVLRAIDPATGQPTGESFYNIRDGATPSIQWTSSNPAALAIARPSDSQQNTIELAVRGPGQSRIGATAPGWRIIETESALITVSRPELFSTAPLRLGQYLQNPLPLNFTANGVVLGSSLRGTLTVRSEDPSLLLLSASQGVRGSSQLTVSFDRQPPVVYAQSLASSGEVRVFLTSPDFSGELSLTVILEPTVLRWGGRTLVNGAFVYAPELTLQQGLGGSPALALEGESGGVNLGQVPGTPPVTLRFSNSDPSIVSLNRLTANLTSQRIAFSALNPGTTQLSLAVSPDVFRLDYSSITVKVTPGPGIITGTREIVIGKDLQSELRLRGAQPGAAISISSTDSTAVLFATSNQAAGTPALTIPMPEAGNPTLFVQSLKDQGETTIRLRTPGLPDSEIQLTHVPSGVQLSAAVSSTGGIASLSVSVAPLDEITATPLLPQALRPGVTAEVRLRSEGAPITLTPNVVTLSALSRSASIGYSPLPPGAEAVVTADAPGFTPSVRSTLRLRGSDVPPVFTNLPSSLLLTRDTVHRLDLFPNVEATATSSDPSKFLLASTPTAVPSASLRLPPNTTALFLHVLADSGTATLRIEPTGRSVQEVAIAFAPLVVTYEQASIILGQSREFRPLFFSTMRPGIGPFRFSPRSADPSIATVTPDVIEWNPAAGPPPSVRVAAVASGRTTVTVEGPEHVYVNPISITVTAPSSASTPSEITLGRNLQMPYSHSFIGALPNGAIVTVTSSDPARLLLSRTAASLGTATTTLSVQPGDFRSQPFFLQARGAEGDVTLRFQFADGSTQTAIVRIVNSWISCESNNAALITLNVGASTFVRCSLRRAGPPTTSFTELLQLLPDAAPLTLRLRSSDPAVFTVTPESAPFRSGTQAFQEFQLRGVAPGTATLLIEQPDGFGPAPGAPIVTVTLPELRSGCLEIALGPDTQRTCEISLPSGVSATAESSHPEFTVVSGSDSQPGAAQVQLTAPRVTIQQLARYGTAEITVRAPGYADLIIPVAGSETQLRLTQLSSPTPLTNLSLRVGNTTPVGLQLSGPARAGSRIFSVINATPTGIIAIDPASVVFGAGQSAVVLNIRGIAPGSAVLNFTAPGNVATPSAPVTVAVTP